MRELLNTVAWLGLNVWAAVLGFVYLFDDQDGLWLLCLALQWGTIIVDRKTRPSEEPKES